MVTGNQTKFLGIYNRLLITKIKFPSIATTGNENNFNPL